jgi:hypothetical protein
MSVQIWTVTCGRLADIDDKTAHFPRKGSV